MVQSQKYSLLLVLFLFITQVTFAENKSPLKISALLHLSGVYAEVGKAFQEGIDLAVEEINNAGGANDQQIKVIYDDTHYDPKVVATLTKKALEIDHTDLTLISTFTEVMISAPTFEKSHTPLVVLWDSSPEIEELGDYTFGVGIWSPSSAEVTANFVKKSNYKSYVVLATHNQWSTSVADKFVELADSAGLQRLEKFIVNPNDSDFRTIATKIARLKPDVVYAPLTDSQVAFWKQLNNSGYTGVRMTSDVIDQIQLEQLGKLAEGLYQTQPSDPKNPETVIMLEKYQKKYQRDCKQVALTAIAYDAIYLIREAVKIAKSTDGEAIKNALYQIKNLPGASGIGSVTPEGSVKKPVSMFQVTNGKFQLVGMH